MSGDFSLSFSPTATAPTSLPIPVTILEDEVVETTEELVVVLSVPQGEEGVALLQNNSTVVILDEDGRHLCVDFTVDRQTDRLACTQIMRDTHTSTFINRLY